MVIDLLSQPQTLSSVVRGDRKFRAARPEDMEAIYLLGLDAWQDGMSIDQYLQACRQSPKYKKGVWHVAEIAAGELVSAVISYVLPPLANRSVIGVGSLATAQAVRGRGFASFVLEQVMGGYVGSGQADIFMLYAEIDFEFYQQFGFIKLPMELQQRSDSACMVRCADSLWDAVLASFSSRPVGYF